MKKINVRRIIEGLKTKTSTPKYRRLLVSFLDQKKRIKVSIGVSKNKKFRIYFGLTILILLMALVGVKLWAGRNVKAAWYNTNWGFRQKIAVTAHTGAQTNVYFTAPTFSSSDTTKFKSNCGDIRFTDASGKQLNYFIVSGCGTATTTIHVLVSSFPAGAQDFYMYYGNPSAINGFSASDFATAATGVTFGSNGSEETGAAPNMYWKFDDATGTSTKDSSVNSNTGTLGGTTIPTWQTPDQCVNGTCLFFDGASSKVTGSKVVNNVQSVAFWIRPNAIATQGLINFDGGTHKISTNGSGVISATGFTSPTYYVNGVATTTPTLTQNQWNYIEITTGTAFNTTSSFTIGTDGINFQKGYIDEVKFYGYARSSAQIQADYLVGATGSGSGSVIGSQPPALSNGLVGYWKMDETSWNGTAGEVKDSSGNGNNGTAVGGGAYNNGVSTGGNTSTTLNNTGAGWPVNLFITDTITISSGTGVGQTRAVASNTATTITISTPWATIPDTTSHYTFATTPGTGKFGNGALLNGIADSISVGNTNTFSWLHGAANPTAFQFTISTWVKFAGAAKNYDAILATTQYNGSSIGVMLDRNVNSAIEAYIFNNGSPSVVSLYTANNVYPTDGNWHLVTWTHNQSLSANNSTLFVDGKLVGTATKANVVPSSANSSNNLSFGAMNGGNQFLMNGSLDETRIYNRALSADEVRQLYTYAPGPVGWWKLDERTGSTANDSSGFANTGTWNGTLGSQWTVGKFGAAGKFNGSDNYVEAANSPSLNITSGITVEFWMNPTSTANADIVSNWDITGNQRKFNCGVTSTTPFCAVSSDGTFVANNQKTANTAVIANQWQHLAMTWSAGTMTFYRNGVPDGTATTTAATLFSSTSAFDIGRAITGGTTVKFHGNVDDVRIYNYARTPQQILEDMRGTDNTTSGVDSTVGGSASATQPASPVGYWKFDEGYGTTANNAGNGGSSLNGTLTNMSSPATSTSGWQTAAGGGCKINGCLAFDHVNDYVNVPDSSAVQFGTNDFSVSAWVYSTLAYPLGTQGTFVSKGYATGFEYGLYQGALISYIAGTRYFGTIPLSTNTWYNVVMVRKSGTAYYYVNGVLDGTMAASGDVSAAGTVINIGNRPGAGNTYFSGLIDEPKIFNFALTPSQVQQEYNMGTAVNYAVGQLDSANFSDGTGNPPVGYWNFEEGTGTSVNDVSGNANTGTWNGTLGKQWTAGKYGKSGNFNGVDNTAQVVPTSSLNNFGTGGITVSAWVYVKGLPSNNFPAIVSKGTGDFSGGVGQGFALFMPFWGGSSYHDINWNVGSSTGNDSLNYAMTTAAMTNKWTFVEAVADSQAASSPQLRLYVNGQLVASTARTKTGSIDVPAQNLYMGLWGGLGRYFNGQIDEVKVYNYARTQAQIAYDYNRGAPVGWWKMNECQGTTANDSSGNGNTGTLTITALGGNANGAGTCNTASSAWGSGATGKFNGSIFLDGNGDFVEPPNGNTNLNITGDLSISAWIKTSSTNVGITSFGDNSGSGNGYLFGIGEGSCGVGRLIFSNGGWSFNCSGATVNNNAWHHVVVTNTSTSTKFYIDGTFNTSIAGLTLRSYTGRRSIGSFDPVTSGGWFAGQIDDVRVYNYALSATQVQQIYNDGFSTFYGPNTGTP